MRLVYKWVAVIGVVCDADHVRTRRQRAIARSLSALLPRGPYADMEAIREAAGGRKLKTMPPQIAVWLAAIAHVRHRHTDYDELLRDGYDRDAARFFVVDAINEKLTEWRSTRLLDPDIDDPAPDE